MERSFHPKPTISSPASISASTISSPAFMSAANSSGSSTAVNRSTLTTLIPVPVSSFAVILVAGALHSTVTLVCSLQRLITFIVDFLYLGSMPARLSQYLEWVLQVLLKALHLTCPPVPRGRYTWALPPGGQHRRTGTCNIHPLTMLQCRGDLRWTYPVPRPYRGRSRQEGTSPVSVRDRSSRPAAPGWDLVKA